MLIWKFNSNLFLRDWPLSYYNNKSLKYLLNLSLTFLIFYTNFLNKFFIKHEVYFIYFYTKLKKIWSFNKKITKYSNNKTERSILGLFNFDKIFKFNSSLNLNMSFNRVLEKINKNQN